MHDLNAIYQQLLSGEISPEDAAEAIKNKDVMHSIQYILNSVTDLSVLDDSDIDFLRMIVMITQFIYNNSDAETGLSDSDYDTLYEIAVFGADDIVSAPNRKNKKIVNHKYPQLRGTLKKTFYLFPDEVRRNPSRKYLDEWVSSMENLYYSKTGKHISLRDTEVYVFPKFDGLSAVFEMDEDGTVSAVLTRGDTTRNEAQDISHIFPNYRRDGNYKGVPYGMKTEVMMRESDLERFNAQYGTNYKNSRSIVAGILNSDEYDPMKTSFLEVVPLREGFKDGSQELAKEAFDVYPNIRCKLSDREKIAKFAEKNRYVFNDLRCDGAVIYIIDEKIQEVLGREHDISNYEVAYKFTEESQLTELVSIEYQVGLFGKVTPVAKFKPVKLKGNTITSASLGSYHRMKEMNLCKGDIVKILYDIIPYMTFDDDCVHSNGRPFAFPRFCPSCGYILNSTGAGYHMFCMNPYCDCRTKGRILNFIRKIGIDDISYSTIDRLYDEGVLTKIQDIYRIEDNKKFITSLDGFGSKKVTKWIKSINDHTIVDDYVMMASIGIPNIGRRIFKKICEMYTIEELIEIASNGALGSIMMVPGIKELTGNKILSGIIENLDLIRFLEDRLVVVESKGRKATTYSVCFTKIRDSETEKLIEKNGGEVVNSLTKDTTYLVIPNHNSTSSKIEKAKKYGTKVYTLEEFRKEVLGC